MKLIALQRFKHDTVTFEEGQMVDVSDRLARYFIINGWVGVPELVKSHPYLPLPAASPVELHIQSGVLSL